MDSRAQAPLGNGGPSTETGPAASAVARLTHDALAAHLRAVETTPVVDFTDDAAEATVAGSTARAPATLPACPAGPNGRGVTVVLAEYEVCLVPSTGAGVGG